MAIISEIPDGSDGDDPNKKPQEPPKNPKEDEENRMVSFESLQTDLLEHCLSRCDFPAISLVSAVFARLIGSSGLDLTRLSQLAITERRLRVSFESLHTDLLELSVQGLLRCDYAAISLVSTVFARLIGSSGLELTRRSQLTITADNNAIAARNHRRMVSLSGLPDHLLELCFARLSRSDYNAISVVSKAFKCIIASTGLNRTRLQLKITERVLYALIGFPPGNHYPCWYELRQRNSSLRLRRISTLRPMPLGSTVVVIEIYVIGGSSDGRSNTTDMIAIDCRNHTLRSLPSMKVARRGAAAGVIDGVIYVVGGCEMRYRNWIEAFDVEAGVWRGTMIIPWPYAEREFVASAVMEDKMFAMGRERFIICERRGLLKEYRYAYGGGPSESLGVWQEASCVVDGMLYTIDPWCRFGQPLILLDPNLMAWRPVPVRGNVLSDPFLCINGSKMARMANLDGKLVVLVVDRRRLLNCYEGENEIVRVQIALERLQGGAIRGTVETFDRVLATHMWPWIERCVAVTL